MPDASATVRHPFSEFFVANGGLGAYNWSVKSGSLPPGLTLNPGVFNANISGVPAARGSYNFTLAAQRSNAENVVVLHDNEPVARAYRDNWRHLKAGATPWSEDALK